MVAEKVEAALDPANESLVLLRCMSFFLAHRVGYCDAAILPVLGAKRTFRGQRECVEFALLRLERPIW